MIDKPSPDMVMVGPMFFRVIPKWMLSKGPVTYWIPASRATPDTIRERLGKCNVNVHEVRLESTNTAIRAVGCGFHDRTWVQGKE